MEDAALRSTGGGGGRPAAFKLYERILGELVCRAATVEYRWAMDGCLRMKGWQTGAGFELIGTGST